MSTVRMGVITAERCALEIVFVAVLAAFLVFGCRKPETEEDRLRAIVGETVEAAKSKDMKKILSHISKDYHDERAGDYDGVRGILLYQFFKNEKISVFVRDVTVGVEGDRALVEARMVFVGGKEVKSLADVAQKEASGYRFSVVFRKEKGEWKAATSEWEETGVLGLL